MNTSSCVAKMGRSQSKYRRYGVVTYNQALPPPQGIFLPLHRSRTRGSRSSPRRRPSTLWRPSKDPPSAKSPALSGKGFAGGNQYTCVIGPPPGLRVGVLDSTATQQIVSGSGVLPENGMRRWAQLESNNRYTTPLRVRK